MPANRSSRCRSCSRSPSSSRKRSRSASCAAILRTEPTARCAAAAAWSSAARTSTRRVAGVAISSGAPFGRPMWHLRREAPMTRTRRSLGLALVALAVAVLAPLALVGCGKKAEQQAQPTPGAAKPLQVGLVFDIGGRGDKSFNDAAYAGLERAQKELGIQFT